jgi:hypothetical protein
MKRFLVLAMKRFLVLLLLLSASYTSAQRREFLRGDEIGLVQEAQEPNDRLKLYVEFARNRLDLIDREMAKNGGKATGERAEIVHDLLWEYERIIDALDDVASLAETKRDLVRKGMASVMRNEPEFLKRLQALENQNPSDRESYRFALNEAIESTKSSIDDNKKVFSKQATDKKLEKEIEAEAKEEQKEREKKEQRKKPN